MAKKQVYAACDGVSRTATVASGGTGTWFGRQLEAYSAAHETGPRPGGRSAAVHWVNAVHEDGCECPAGQFAD